MVRRAASPFRDCRRPGLCSDKGQGPGAAFINQSDVFLTGPQISPGQWQGRTGVPGLLRSEAELKPRQAGQGRGERRAGPARRARLWLCRAPPRGCVGGSPLSGCQNGHQSVCCHIVWVHSGRCLMGWVGEAGSKVLGAGRAGAGRGGPGGAACAPRFLPVEVEGKPCVSWWEQRHEEGGVPGSSMFIKCLCPAGSPVFQNQRFSCVCFGVECFCHSSCKMDKSCQRI